MASSPAAARRHGSLGVRRWLIALPLALLATAAGSWAGARAVSGGSAGIAQLSLQGASGAPLVEDLAAVSISASYSAQAVGAYGTGGAVVHVIATTAVDASSLDPSLVSQLDTTRWRSATLTLDDVTGSPVYRLDTPTVLAWALQGGGGAVRRTGPSGATPGSGTAPSGATPGSSTAPPAGTADSVRIVLSSDRVTTAHLAPGTTSSTPPTSTPPTTAPRPPVQTCLANPQKPTSPHPDFPVAAYEVPTAGLIRQTSPTLATVVSGGRRETIAVFGDEDGMLYVVDAATCQLLPGWPQPLAVPAGQLRRGLPASDAHAVIESTPAVGFPRGAAGPSLIVVGAGSTWDNTGVGEVEAFDLQGRAQWDFPVQGSPQNANGVFSSPSFGPVVPGTGVDVVFGSWDGYLYVLDARGNEVARYDNAETIWSSPALYRMPGRETDDIVVGLDKTQTHLAGGCVGGELADLRYGQIPVGTPGAAGATGIGTTYHGAELHAAAPRAGLYLVHESACQGAPPGGHRGQAIWSSPAIGELAGRLVAAVGTSFYDSPFGPGTDELYVYPLTAAGTFRWTPLWEGRTPGPVLGSPAIGPLAPPTSEPGAGPTEVGVVDTSFVCPGGAETRASCLSTGSSAVQAWVAPSDPAARQLRLLWSRRLPGGDSLDSPVLAPLRGERGNDVLVGSAGGLFPLAGSTGAFLDGTGVDPPQLAIHSACILFDSPAVADVAGPGPYSGWYAFELCSYGGAGARGGGLFAYHLPEPPGAAPAWPMFRGDPTHSGVSWSSLRAAAPAGDPTG